jgi:hypothetical protein
MTAAATRMSWPKRILFGCAALGAFIFLFVVAVRVTINEIFRGGGIESSSRIPAYAASPYWNTRSMWPAPMLQKSSGLASAWGAFVARSADLLAHSDAFDQSVRRLRELVSVHQGFFEDLHTQSQSGSGRALSATLSIPAKEFDSTLADLKRLARVDAVTEAGEDSAVRLATVERHLAAAQTNLSRLQKLEHERKGDLSQAVALEKEIAQANEGLSEAEREHDSLVSTVAQAHIRFTLMEDYRAPLEANVAGNLLALRNSAIAGIGAILSSVAVILGVVFEYGLPLLFWAALLFLPARYAWRRFRRPSGSLAAAN